MDASRQSGDRDLIRKCIVDLQRSVDENQYLLINFLAWAIPTLGFIGTILGIIGAMTNAANIVQASDPGEQAVAIRTVGTYLGSAFYTTLIGLIWSFIARLLITSVRKREAELFELLEDHALRKSA
jgi:flagellar motor component MotA